MSYTSTTLSDPSEIQVPVNETNEIRALAEQLYRDTNCEPNHDDQNWLCAERMIAQRRRVQAEIEKAAVRGHF